MSMTGVPATLPAHPLSRKAVCKLLNKSLKPLRVASPTP